ncbi:MAG: hypothetical protein KAS48_04590 [Gammaproteobacteria bacterium]|nr:hypothetical protein [Gammaproteobacteria bacterium]MCK5092295.1 hypothetical protein [Gammaproteobacteria bacterium]
MVPIDSQKLIRCSVSSQDGIPTTRFIEVEVFKLWHYMMTNKHGLSVSGLSLCLWVNEEEFRQKEKLYTKSGEVETVHRIVVAIFDSKNGFSHMTSRYALDHDVNKVKSILLSHMPKNFANKESFEVETFPGRVIEKGKISSMNEIILGLSN